MQQREEKVSIFIFENYSLYVLNSIIELYGIEYFLY